ncbi:TetR/AcrR family transcriptional regulator [Jiangella alkaliphila]|uniref:DNA-binding transcriptional regulator, AcrR family n=1 Tax=Jiangella alkaliphila TaxID=419479 RepID=A0A1H2LUK7_9ACTN|nr:TetR/AcrR family transcriptional regulator [Jiangella alkaliphila]SDU84677.1 DNA-binding transcriptional regulator, AcrR family [Jiangella alkaliphila]
MVLDDVEEGRTARKRRAILEAATEVFLQHGYIGASMDEVAAKAAVSKQTVYKQFADKEHLFAEIIVGRTGALGDRLAAVYATLDDATDVRTALRDVGGQLLQSLSRPDVLQLRRLVIAEADRFPDVSGTWWERAFHPSLVLLGEALQRMAGRGLLRDLDDPTLAAYHLAGLVMYKPMNRMMFAGTAAVSPPDELEYLADRAADVFLAAYGR